MFFKNSKELRNQNMARYRGNGNIIRKHEEEIVYQTGERRK